MTDNITDFPGRTAPAIMRNDNLLIRPLPPITDNPPEELPPGGKIVAIVDTEATGLDPSSAKIIELSIQLVAVNANGEVIGHTAPVSWLEDPGEPLSEDVKRITRLHDEQLAGQVIDERLVISLLSRADLIVAHNAPYDAALIERRFPSLAGRAWACSMREIPWLYLGLDGRQMGYLLIQHSWHNLFAHRAEADVWALFHLLQCRGSIDRDTPRTHLQRLLEASARQTVRISAWHAPYAVKDRLKASGYTWCAKDKVWRREVAKADVSAELDALGRLGVRNPGQQVITAAERHRPLKRPPVNLDAEPDPKPF